MSIHTTEIVHSLADIYARWDNRIPSHDVPLLEDAVLEMVQPDMIPVRYHRASARARDPTNAPFIDSHEVEVLALVLRDLPFTISLCVNFHAGARLVFFSRRFQISVPSNQATPCV